MVFDHFTGGLLVYIESRFDKCRFNVYARLHQLAHGPRFAYGVERPRQLAPSRFPRAPLAVSYPAISLTIATVSRHRRPPKAPAERRQPTIYPDRARTIASVTSSPPFQCPPCPHPGDERRELPAQVQPGRTPSPSSRRSRRRINRTLDAFSSCSCNVAALPDLLPSVTSQRVHFCSALLVDVQRKGPL